MNCCAFTSPRRARMMVREAASIFFRSDAGTNGTCAMRLAPAAAASRVMSKAGRASVVATRDAALNVPSAAFPRPCPTSWAT